MAEPVALHLPGVTEDRYPGTRDETFNYFDFDYSSPLIQHDEHQFKGTRGKPVSRKGTGNWIRSKLRRSASALFNPGQDRTEGGIFETWYHELHRWPDKVLPDVMLEALTEAPPVFICYYERVMSPPPEFRRRTIMHTSRADIAFWSDSPPQEIAMDRLRPFEGSETGVSPLIVIGPPVDSCPQNLGTALELLASNAPDLVPATEPGFGQATSAAFTGR